MALLWVTSPFSNASAQPTEDDLERARGLFEEGIALIDQERWAEAEESFRGCLEIRGSPIVEYNLASTLEAQGKLIEAADTLRSVLAGTELSEVLRRASQERLESIEPRIGSLVIVVRGAAAETSVMLDGEPLDESVLSVPIAIDPGRHRIVARGAAGAAAQTITIPDGASVEVELTLTPHDPRSVAAASPPTGSTDAVESRPHYRKAWFWITVGGVAAAAAAVGILFGSSGTSDPTVGSFPPGLITVGVGR